MDARRCCASSTSRPARREEAAPLVLGVAADVRRVAEPLGLLDAVARAERVHDEHESAGDPRHLAHRLRDVGEMVRRDARHARRRSIPSANGRSSAKRSRPARMPGAGSQLTTSQPRLAQPARDVAAAGRDVERRLRPAPTRPADRGPPLRVSRARPIESARSLQGSLMPLAASSTARRAASSIVGSSGCRVRPRSLGQDPPALLGVRAVEADDDRQSMRRCSSA